MVTLLFLRKKTCAQSNEGRDSCIYATEKPASPKIILEVQAQFTTRPQTPRFESQLSPLTSRDLE